MSEDADRLKNLQRAFPRVFGRSMLSWGLEYAQGWDALVRLLCARLDEILDESEGAHFEIRQIKEKFGRLRLYYVLDGTAEEVAIAIRKAVDQAEAASARICERCGAPASDRRIDGSSWIAALCDACRAYLQRGE
jgi:hypothetical protein